MVFVSYSLGTNTIILGEISATSLVLVTVYQFPLKNLAAVLIDMSFGGLILGQVVHGNDI